ncbi:15-hydroxyprostaglandin dehydrogenase [NAD(+)] [Amyelois transitella]|uniref:15-hydroxyprostaglandin dehydrogenase [NAD(+)] n=1 Tax=Amyelois transitella TaxID=680683 RepID=UPI00067CCB0F|nr:15-hydroxyprostaglandin dehydrogenase [NAD(+)] [Amyelois transitella]
MSVPFDLKDKVCLVTGGAAGIGAAVVRTFLMENARAVVFLDVAEREGFTLEAELLTRFGPLRAKFIKCDVSDEETLSDAFKQVLNKYTKLDVVVNSAAVLGTGQSFKRTIDINFTGTVASTMRAVEVMGKDNGGNGGTVLNISSLLALKQHPHLPVYAATKTAVLYFSNAFGAELHYSKTQVRVLTVCLGPTDTAILQRLNLEHFNKDGACLTPTPERQKVESAATGILETIYKGTSGSTWMIANDKPAVEITHIISKGFETLSNLPKD